jgi:hypothetical protein
LFSYADYPIYDGEQFFPPLSLAKISAQISSECDPAQYMLNVFEVYIWGIKGLMALLPKAVIERIATQRISMGFSGDTWPRRVDKLELQSKSVKDSLALLNEFKGLKEVQLMVWTGYHWVTTSDQRRDMKQAIKECTRMWKLCRWSRRALYYCRAY